MKTTCLINNYNYDKYIADAIDSAVNQSVQFDEIIIVDDGSTDSSRDIISGKAKLYHNIKYLFKANGGQMTSFNAGYELSSGELICFLDSDDILNNDYLEKTINFMNKYKSCDFVFCAYEMFGRIGKKISLYQHDNDLGISVVRVAQKRSWIGGPTSTLAIRRNLAEKILPYPNTEEWRLCADDVLIYGSSLVGARKYFHAETLVRYRMHPDNGFKDRKFSAVDVLRKDLAINRLINHYRNIMGYDQNLSVFAWKEFKTIPLPDIKLLQEYCKIVRDGGEKWSTRIKHYRKLLKHYITTRRK